MEWPASPGRYGQFTWARSAFFLRKLRRAEQPKPVYGFLFCYTCREKIRSDRIVWDEATDKEFCSIGCRDTYEPVEE